MLLIYLVHSLFLCILSKCFCKKSRCSIVYASENVVVINKQYDLKINSNNKNEYTVQTFMKENCPLLASKKLCHEYYFVHRLDYATSGVMCIPVRKDVCRHFSNAFLTRKTKKYYVALVRGWMSQETVAVDVPIGEDLRKRDVQKMCTLTASNVKHCQHSRESRTIILVLEKGLYANYPASKILIRPITGRRHQIRVHCNFLGHTIVGDFTYSNKKDTKPFRMFLHSLRLILPNPIENLDVQTEDPFRDQISDWRRIDVLNELNLAAFHKIDQCCV